MYSSSMSSWSTPLVILLFKQVSLQQRKAAFVTVVRHTRQGYRNSLKEYIQMMEIHITHEPYMPFLVGAPWLT